MNCLPNEINKLILDYLYTCNDKQKLILNNLLPRLLIITNHLVEYSYHQLNHVHDTNANPSNPVY